MQHDPFALKHAPPADIAGNDRKFGIKAPGEDHRVAGGSIGRGRAQDGARRHVERRDQRLQVGLGDVRHVGHEHHQARRIARGGDARAERGRHPLMRVADRLRPHVETGQFPLARRRVGAALGQGDHDLRSRRARDPRGVVERRLAAHILHELVGPPHPG